ncbi:SDR family oxidoreductase [Solimonas sp. K1W22B-7]|uniref:SDR family NAD(P)-dependent oxidoreductase n=1 Tax=Solimonas sp. K1W22B-7 TaxID=2303331 RepID=UPI000E3306F9|nr:SDR family oxidoreductase [Solimonas sp. K1W22B-7]AXQ28290.1 SDR family oxidoreductase [Solimonas sp. K1W22B-7]
MSADAFSLRGRKALVTGASSGFGQHFARVLARAGAEVAVAARRADRLSGLVAEITAAGGSALALAMDVSSRASVRSGFDELAARWGAADIVVNNAGVGANARALDCDDAAWDAVLDTNLRGAWMVAQEAAQRLVAAQRGGSIINITSILASRVSAGISPYCASKAGLAHLTRALALEWARHGIRVNSLAPGYFSTEINQDYLASEAGEKLRARVPFRRFGQYEDLDGPLLLLASDAGRYMSGAEIVVDGGHSCASV